MKKEKQIEQIRLEFSEIKEVLGERSIRRWCAAKSRAYDRAHKRGGGTVVSAATGISRPCIYRGIKEIEQCSAGVGSNLMYFSLVSIFRPVRT